MTGGIGARVRAGVRYAELPMLRAYRLWFEHTRTCEECKRVHRAQDGCAAGRNLWDAYRHIRGGGN